MAGLTTAYGNPVPRQINTPLASSASQRTPDTGKTLALVGSFPYLDPSLVYTVSSSAALKALNPADQTLKLIERLIYNCAPNESQARARPAAVHLVNALNSTAAVATLYDAQPQASLDFQSNLFGAIGNRLTLTVAPGTAQGKKYAIAGPGLPTAVYDNVGGANIMTVNYTGTEATTMVMAYDQTTGLRISYTKTGIAVGTFTPVQMAWDGAIMVTPSLAPVGGAFTVTITGTSKTTGLPLVDVLTWPDAGGAAAQVSDPFSAVTTIVFATTIGTPTFSIAGYAFDLTPGAEYPSASSFSDRINQFTTQLFTSTIGSVTAAGLDSALLDSFASATIKSAAKSLTADVNAAVVAMAGAFLVTVTRATGADEAPVDGITLLGGGTNGTESSQRYADALTLLDAVSVTHLWMDTDNTAYQAEGLDHVVTNEGVGGKARQLWLGSTASESLTVLRARVLNLNAKQVSLWYQEFNRLSPASVATWYAPKYLALQQAALMCAMAPGEPATYKRPNVLAYRSSATTNADTLQATIMQEGLSFVSFVNGMGNINIRPVTTYGVGDSVYFTEPGCVESYYMSTNDVHAAVTAARALGANNVRFTSSDYQSIVERRLNLQLSGTSRLIKAWDASSLVIQTVNGDWYRATYNVQPIQGINFIETQPVAASVEG